MTPAPEDVEIDRPFGVGIDPADMVMFPIWAFLFGWLGAQYGIDPDYGMYGAIAAWMLGTRVKRFFVGRAPVYVGNRVANVAVGLLVFVGGLPLTVNAAGYWSGGFSVGGTPANVIAASLLLAGFVVDGWRRKQARERLSTQPQTEQSEVELDFAEEEGVEEVVPVSVGVDEHT